MPRGLDRYVVRPPDPGPLVQEAPAVYRQRHPERTALYQLFEEHWDRYCLQHEERFEPVSGPLRPEVQRAVPAYLECGRLQNGFARLRCTTCGQEEFLAFSCQTRQLCPSCQAKRAALFAERLAEEVLSPAASHQHVVWTIPIALRDLFRREPRLIGLLSRAAYTALRVWLQTVLGDEVVPGFVACLHTFGAFAGNFHPHLHSLATLGGFTEDGELVPVDELDCGAIEPLFRRRVLDELVAADWLQEETRERFLAWEHSGFSVHGSEPIGPDDRATIERVGRYMARPPLAAEAVHQLPDGQMLVETPPHHESGAMSVELDPLDLIDRLVQHVPARGVHLTRYYGAYSARGRRVPLRQPVLEPVPEALFPEEEESEFLRRRKRSWARMIKKIYEVDPLQCRRCGGVLKIVAFLSEPEVVWAILRHLQETATGEAVGVGVGDAEVVPPPGQHHATRGGRGRGPPGWQFPGDESEVTDLDRA